MKKRLALLTLIVSIVLIFALSASAAVTCVADSFFNAKNYGEAMKHYNKFAAKYFDNASKPEVVNYLFGYESTKKIYVNRAVDSAKIALYSFYMETLCHIYLKDYEGALNSAGSAIACFNIEKVLTRKSLTSTGNPETVRIALPENMVNDYLAKINALPLQVKDMLPAMERTSRERRAVEITLAGTAQGPAYDQLMAKFMALVRTEKTYIDFIVMAVSRDLDAKNFASFETLVHFMRNYNPMDRSATSLVEVSDKLIKKMTALALNNQGSDIPTATLYNTKMQLLISVNAYIKGYLATSGR